MQQVYKLRNLINSFLDQGMYDEALQELDNQTKDFAENKTDNLLLLAEIAGSYITLGSESYNLEAVRKGISIFEENKEILKTVVTEDSIDYCLGNGFHAIYKIMTHSKKDFFPTPENVKDELFEAKQFYLKAFKKVNPKKINDYSIKLLTNLGNNLNHSGRIVEALQHFDMVLKYNPEFPQAIVSKADGLFYMVRATDCALTISLFAEIYRLYKKVSEKDIVIEEVKKSIEYGLNYSSKFLTTNNFDLETIDDDFALNNNEYLKHSESIKFFLDNFLSLSEHSLYCKCNGAKIDDIIIGFPGFKTTDKRIFQLELLNNRLKSEFAFARQLYYDFLTREQIDTVHYEDVIAGIINGIKYEQLRTSFRICFGVLDKIAEGLCYLFELETKDGENIYFESFWNSKKDPTRWAKINSIRNIHLTALYSIACDLNKKNGEFGFYKTWRNRLEHGLFSLSNSDYKSRIWEDESFAEKTTDINFEQQTKYLLQLTRAAIFSFVFCIRHELITTKNDCC